MSDVIRAIYEQGQLRPLDPVHLSEGQRVRLAILSEREQARAVLADLLAPSIAETLEEIDEAALVALIDADLRESRSLSEAILEERREGP